MVENNKYTPKNEKKLSYKRLGISLAIVLTFAWISKLIYDNIPFFNQPNHSSPSSWGQRSISLWWPIPIEQIQADSLLINKTQTFLEHHLWANKVTINKASKENLTVNDLQLVEDKISIIPPFTSWELSDKEIIFYLEWRPPSQSFLWNEIWIYLTWKTSDKIREEIAENIVKINKQSLINKATEIIESEIKTLLDCKSVIINKQKENLDENVLIDIKNTIIGIKNLMSWKLKKIKILIYWNSEWISRPCWPDEFCLYVKWKSPEEIWTELNDINLEQ